MLFSALNAMGYDRENNTAGMTHARKKIRNVLLGHTWSERYPDLREAIGTYHPWHLLRAVLAKPKTVVQNTSSFIPDFRRFSREPIVRKLWGFFKTYQTREAGSLFPLFAREAARLIAFTRWSPPGLKKIVLIANPLDAYWSGYEFRIGRVGYIVVGPGADRNQGEVIRHELLHLLAPALRITRRITTSRYSKHLATMGYGSQRIINREYVVRSLNFLYESEMLKKDIGKAIKREEKHFPHIREVMKSVKMKIERGRP